MSAEPGSSSFDRSCWNERYRTQPSPYGDEPNQFVREIATPFPPGRALDVACGQGRNAVWLAGRGHQVTAVDLSDVAIEAGRALAADKGVEVEFRVGDFLEWDPPAAGFDLVLLSYLQLPPRDRRRAHRLAVASVGPGGRLLLIAHHRENLEHGVGGPQDPEVLYDESMLGEDFAGLAVERNERVTRRVEPESGTDEAIDVLFVGRRAGPGGRRSTPSRTSS